MSTVVDISVLRIEVTVHHVGIQAGVMKGTDPDLRLVIGRDHIPEI